MSTAVQRRRGTTAQHASFAGLEGELTVDTTKDTLVIHDGSTAGGRPLLREDQSNLPTSAPTTGIYNASGSLAISTSSVGRVFVDASGRVGVGTNSLSRTFNVAGSAVFDDGTVQTTVWPQISTGVAGLGTNNNYPVALVTNGSERLRVTTGGLVGVGTSAPYGPIEIQGSQFAYFRNSCAGQAPAGSIGNGMIALGTNVQSADGGAALVYGVPYGTSGFDIASWDGTNYVRRFRIDNQGRVAIGTTSPGSALHVYGGPGEIRVESSTSSDGFIRFTNTSGSMSVGMSGAAQNIFLLSDRTNSHVAYQYVGGASGSHIWLTANTERARIDSSGRLLVGTSTSGTALFQVNAQASANGNAFRSSHRIADSGTGSTQSVTGAPYISYCYGFNAASTVPAIAINGEDFASGTTGLQLEFNRLRSSGAVASGDRLGRIIFGGDDATNIIGAAAIEAWVDGTPGANDMPGRLVFSTTADGAASPTEAMRITSGGNVMISSTAYTTARLGIGGYANGDRLGVYMRASTDPATPFDFRNAANTTVGSIATTASATAYNTSSDYRLKENIVAVADGIPRLLQLKPSRFNFIADPAKTVDGFLAHEAAQVVPECVTGEKDAVDDDDNPVYQGIDQSKLVPLLTAALQEAVSEIESLKARLTAAGI